MAARYREIAAQLGFRINEREFAIGSSLPSEADLAAEFAVSRGTVRSALASLEQKGLISPIRGRGWVIRSISQIQGFGRLMGFGQWTRSRGMTAGGSILERTRDHPTAEEARDLGVPLRDKGFRVLRVRTLDAQPVMLERSYFPEWLAPRVAALAEDVPSIVVSFESTGVSVAQGRHLIDAVTASTVDADTLGIRRSSPLLRVRHVAVTYEGLPLWSNDDRYVPGTVVFEVLAASQVAPSDVK